MPGMIKKEDIEKVRATADLYDIVSATVTLKPSGTGTYVGLCPFHDEKTPSFSVRPALGVWHCFGCGLRRRRVRLRGASGEHRLPRRRWSCSPTNTISNCITTEPTTPPAHTGSKRARLLEANEAAQEFFVSQLMTKEALAARKLLDGRNFSQADCQRFGCGYAPQGWDNLVRHLARQGLHAAGDARCGTRPSGPAWRLRLFPWPRDMADS